VPAPPPFPRWLALAALLGLLASGSLCSFWILTDRAEFRGGAPTTPGPTER
jgi:uncharacterized protein involved in exopolysaccharide biosynthesis